MSVPCLVCTKRKNVNEVAKLNQNLDNKIKEINLYWPHLTIQRNKIPTTTPGRKNREPRNGVSL